MKQVMYRYSDTSQSSNITEISDNTALSTRSVSFSTLEFHEHEVVLGCSPATTHGPPLEIGWDQVDSLSISIDDYEQKRPPRRIREELVMPGVMREEVLIGNGYTMNQIHQQLKALQDEKRSVGKGSLKNFSLMMLGRASRKFKKILKSTKQSGSG